MLKRYMNIHTGFLALKGEESKEDWICLTYSTLASAVYNWLPREARNASTCLLLPSLSTFMVLGGVCGSEKKINSYLS